MITVETVIAMAIRSSSVMDELGQALRSDLCIANTFYRNIATFADEFLLTHRTLPGVGDWEMWLETLPEGMQRDGTREHLGGLLAMDLSAYTGEYFAPEALKILQHAAAQVAKSRLMELPDVPLEAFTTLAAQLEGIGGSGLQGLAHLEDVDIWAHKAVMHEDWITTGIHKLDQQIGGWGKELWIVFADSGVGKSMFLQNAAATAARVGKRVLHVSLELGIRPQILRYYRQIAQVTRAEFNKDIKEVRDQLKHWMRFAHGQVLLLQYPAYTITPDDLKRTVERVNRTIGEVDVLALDYLDLMTLPRAVSAGRGYEDLGRLTHEVRGFCTTFDMTVLTASQAVRKPRRAHRLVQQDMGDSYGKVRGADGLLGLWEPEYFEDTHEALLGVLKVRDNSGRGIEVPVYVNRDRALIADMDHHLTIQLRNKINDWPPPMLPQGQPQGVSGP